MKNLNDQIEELTELQFNQSEQKRLEEKYQDLTSTQAFEGFIKGCKATMNISQVLSLVLAFGVPLMIASRMPAIAIPVFIGTWCLLFLWEFAKRWNLDKLNTLRIVNKSKKFKIDLKYYRFACVVLLCGSIVLSFVGSPYVVKQFAKHEPLISVDSIRSDFKNQLALVNNHWNELKEEYQNKAIQIHEQNSWKGKTSRQARIPKLKMELKVSEMQDSLNSAVAYLTKLQNSEIRLAKDKNQQILLDHDKWCFQFGFFGSLCAVVIDLLLILLARIVANHEERKIKENHSRKELLNSLEETESERTEKRTIKKTEQKKERDFQPITETEPKKESIQIAFGRKKEGSFSEENGQRIVFLEMKKGPRKGELIAKTKEDILNLINNASNQHSPRTLFLKDLIKQF